MIRSSRGRLTLRRSSIIGVVDKYFPTVAGLLERIQVEGDEVVEEVPLNLSAEYVYF